MISRRRRPTRPKKVIVPNTMRQMLKLIDQFLANPALKSEGRKLWDVMSALRGPDNGIGKELTTAVIRRAAFPQAAKSKHLQTYVLIAPLSSNYRKR